jgi:hypothetical protein
MLSLRFAFTMPSYTRHFLILPFVFVFCIQKYLYFANQIIAVSQMNAIHIFDIYTSMSLQMTAYTMGTGAQWPNVIFPEFDRMIEKARSQTGAAFVGFCPRVKHEDRQDYEDFAYNNQE